MKNSKRPVGTAQTPGPDAIKAWGPEIARAIIIRAVVNLVEFLIRLHN